MNEGFPSFEKCPEHIPTLEEVISVFEKLRGKEYEVSCCLKDKEDLPYYMEVIASENLPKRNADYIYYRKGAYEGAGQSSETEIDRMYYNEEDVPYNGEVVARYVEGEWEIL